MRRTTIVVALALVAACGGTDSTPIEGQAAPTTARPAPGTLVPSSSIAPTTTAEPIPSTAPPATTAPAPVVVPTPDGDVDEATKAAVLAGYEHYLAGLEACGESPATCDPDEYTVARSMVNMLLRESARYMSDNNLVATQGPMTYKVQALTQSEVPGSYSLDVCWTDSAVVSDTRGTPDPSDDEVVNDAVVSVRTDWTMTPTPDGWRPSIALKLSEKNGAACAQS